MTDTSPTTAFRQFKDEELLPVTGEGETGGEFAVPRARAILYCLINALLTGCLYGYSTGIIAGTGQSVVHDFYEDKSASSDSYTWLWSFVTADILFGGMLGSIVGPPIANKIGRKWALVVTGAICAVFSLCLSFAAKEDGGNVFYALAIISRTCLGVSVGMSCTVGPTYTNEMAPAGMAGKLGTMFQLFLCSAITLAYAVNYVFNVQNATYVTLTNWRIEFGIGAIFGVLLVLAGAFVLPETPVYLASKRVADAAEAEYTREGPGAAGEDADGIDTSRAEWLRFFCPKAVKDLKFLVLATMLAVSQQLTGINAVMFYAPTIFKAAGMENTALVTFLVAGLWNIASVFPATVLVDKLGRRPLMVTALGAMAAALWIMGGGTQFLCESTTSFNAITNVTGTTMHCDKAGSGLLVAGVMLFLLAFECGPGPLFFVIASEMFEAPKLKSVGLAYCNVVGWLLNIVVTLAFPKLSALSLKVQWLNTYWVLAIVATLSFVYLLIFLPETGGAETTVVPADEREDNSPGLDKERNLLLAEERSEALSDV